VDYCLYGYIQQTIKTSFNILQYDSLGEPEFSMINDVTIY